MLLPTVQISQPISARTAAKRVCHLEDATHKIGQSWLKLFTGHKVAECKENRVMDLSAVADLKPEIAWEKLRVADEARDLDDFREV
jgi:chromosome condensin MukBEF ATPase and DNA-binding subunit MukB